jgi:hypothetical protein
VRTASWRGRKPAKRPIRDEQQRVWMRGVEMARARRWPPPPRAAGGGGGRGGGKKRAGVCSGGWYAIHRPGRRPARARKDPFPPTFLCVCRLFFTGKVALSSLTADGGPCVCVRVCVCCGPRCCTTSTQLHVHFGTVRERPWEGSHDNVSVVALHRVACTVCPIFRNR